jgi:hypothetical protein
VIKVIASFALTLSQLAQRSLKPVYITELLFAMAIMWQSSCAYAEVVNIPPLLEEDGINQDFLQSKMSGKGILFCSGKIGLDIALDCKTGRVNNYIIRSDIYRIASSGWRLITVLQDEKAGVWYYFYQR